MQRASDVQLPPVPLGFIRIGWRGFALTLPEDWNLSFHSPVPAMGRQGLLVFSDLRGPAFEIRWQAPRRFKLLRVKPEAALQARLAKLRRVGVPEAVEGAFLLRKQGLALAADGQLIFELHCLRAPERLEDVTRDFLAGLRAMAEGPWLWSLYTIEAWLPAAARLRTVALRAGECRMEFGLPRKRVVLSGAAIPAWAPGGRVMVGGVSLAKQILRGRALSAWAAEKFPCVRAGTGAWEEGEDCALWRGRTRRMGRATRHELQLCHVPERNCIHWTHWFKSGK